MQSSITKSNLILRDIDLLSVMAKRTTLIVYFTITTLDETIRRKIKPIAASTFPYLTDDFENINGVVKAVSDAGAKDLVPGVLDLRASYRNRVLSFVKADFPELLPNYLALYKSAYAPKDYVGKIYRAVETARRKCDFKKFEMPVLREKQAKLEAWVKNDGRGCPPINYQH